MIMLYFSGTGNSKYIAELFCGHMNAVCHSIEESLDFKALIEADDIIGFCYPVYMSRVPRIMREFVSRHMKSLKDKKLIIFCTQLIFSGDGARAFTDMFPRGYVEVLYAEHFFMPNNVTNLRILSDALVSEKRIKKNIAEAERKMRTVCGNIKAGKVKKRGFNILSRALGLPQAVFLSAVENRANNSVRVTNDCSKCRVCVSVCPMGNLAYDGGIITHKRNCTVCYRCVNKCPKKAITVFYHGKVNKQYKGLEGVK